MSFYVSTATFFLLHCDEWDRVVALPRHKFVTGATLLQLCIFMQTSLDSIMVRVFDLSSVNGTFDRVNQRLKAVICCFSATHAA